MIWPEGMKRTKQREDVYRALEASEGPLSAVEIYERLERHYAISTVYRALAAFEKAGIVSKSTLMNTDTALYALNEGGHQHYAICLRCHRKIPIDGCPFEDASGQSVPEGFLVTGHKIEVYGYCEKCREKAMDQHMRGEQTCGNI